MVLGALKGPPFEPLESVDLKILQLKTALLLALASVKRVGDLEALSTSPSFGVWCWRLEGNSQTQTRLCA